MGISPEFELFLSQEIQEKRKKLCCELDWTPPDKKQEGHYFIFYIQ